MTSYARVVTARFKPATIDEGIRVMNERVQPNLKHKQGFQSWELLVNRKTGNMASVSHFATEEDAQAGGDQEFQDRTAMMERFLDGSTHLEIYEVDAQS
jgi:heme-degrading monooxygenase HmoA